MERVDGEIDDRAHHTDQDEEACRGMLREVADTFERSGLLNDAVYARGIAISMRRSGKSKKAIATKLAIKGIGADGIAAALRESDGEEPDGDAERKAAVAFARKKRFTTRKNMTEEKILAAFARAGFSYEITRAALKTLETPLE